MVLELIRQRPGLLSGADLPYALKDAHLYPAVITLCHPAILYFQTSVCAGGAQLNSLI